MSNFNRTIIIFLTFATLLCTLSGPALGTHGGKELRLSVRAAADNIHSVIEANRTIYSGYIVDRLEKTTALRSTENWATEDTLLLPAQFLRKSSEISNDPAKGVSYFLKSLWAINKNNLPSSGKENEAFRKVAENPREPVSWIEQTGGKKVFRIVYPDFATNGSCVSCHNNHPDSPKKDFKKGDVMGGILISLPLSKQDAEPDLRDHTIPPEVVSEYIYTILQADRTVYSKYIVERLENKNIIRASEYWWIENGLPLPAQYLASIAGLVRKQNREVDFRLISLWPINKQNGPANEFERSGLKSVARNPIRPHVDQTTLADKRYFRAIYPDIAVTESCVGCHNANTKSPRHDFKLNDVMGGIAITLAIK